LLGYSDPIWTTHGGFNCAQIGPSLVQLLHSHSAIGMPGIFLEPKWLDPIEILEM
jgi:hypothetical protein